MKPIPFSKMAGTGNDFLIIDNRTGIVPEEVKRSLARATCDRRKSIGADGLMLVEAAENADFTMRLFNPDGSEAEMCGNGARAIANFAYVKGIAGPEMRIQTLAGIVEGSVTPEAVQIHLWRLPEIAPIHRQIMVGGKLMDVYYLEVGVPHVVVFQQFVERVSDATLHQLGKEIRYHPSFPRGANVDFVEVTGVQNLIIRTYERGVEQETLACGTGCAAASLTAHQIYGVESPVTLKARGGLIQVSFTQSSAGWDVFLKGAVQHIMDGLILPDAWNWNQF